MITATHTISTKIGSGIFLIRDVAQILRLDPDKVRRWINTYWDLRFSNDNKYSFGDKGYKAIDFYTLIEFYTFYKLRENGFSAQYIQKIHDQIGKDLKTRYPFAKAGISHDRKQVWYECLENYIKADGKRQFSIKGLIEPFLSRIDFNKEELAERYYPLEKSKNVVVDPEHQFGQPTITGTNIRTETLYSLYKGGETYKDLSVLYNIPIPKIKDAILFHKNAA